MVSLIYNKALELQAGAYDNTDAITLMSTDIDRIAGSMSTIQDLWARVIEIGIGIWLLEIQLGWVCVAPIIVVIGMSCLDGMIILMLIVF
jgi:ATP-binding cassette subfamily C (CFTR/MRP) protein 1